MARGRNADAFMQRGRGSALLFGDAADEQARVQRAGLHRAFGVEVSQQLLRDTDVTELKADPEHPAA